jgi:hypothetical protein
MAIRAQALSHQARYGDAAYRRRPVAVLISLYNTIPYSKLVFFLSAG